MPCDFLLILQDLISEALPGQKCYYEQQSVHSDDGDKGIWMTWKFIYLLEKRLCSSVYILENRFNSSV